MKTALDAFVWAAGAVAGRSQEIPAAPRYAAAFRGLADLCRFISCELPSARVVALAFCVTGGDDGVPPQSDEAQRRALWRELGMKLYERMEPQAQLTVAQDGEIAVRSVDPASQMPLLCEAIWLWQMLGIAVEGRLNSLPQLMQNPQTGQFAIDKGGMTVVIPRHEAAAISNEQQKLQVIAMALDLELRLLISALCPERTAALKAVERERVRAKQEQEMKAASPIIQASN